MTDPLSQAAARAKAFAAGLANRPQTTAPAPATSPIQQLAAMTPATPANINTSRAGTGPAPQTAVVIASTVIIIGERGALFVYSGTPTLGNLIASIAGAPGTDPYGNAYLIGINQYSNNGSVWVATNTNIGMAIFTATSPAGPYSSELLNIAGAYYTNANQSASLAPRSNQTFQIQSGTAEATDNIAGLTLVSQPAGTAAYVQVNSGMVAAEPGSPTDPETWHDLTSFSSGWSAGSPAPRVKLLAESNFAFIEGVMDYDSTFSGNTTPCTLSGLSGYTPAVNQLILGTGSNANLLLCQVSSSGDINLYDAPSGTNAISFSGMYPLD